MVAEQRLLDNVIAKGRQENSSLRRSCSGLHDELTGLKQQMQVLETLRCMTKRLSAMIGLSQMLLTAIWL